MRWIMAPLLLAILNAGCASQPPRDDREAIAEFVAVAELESMDKVRFRDQFNYKQLTEDYVLLQSRGDYYLVEFKRRCRELNQTEIMPDFRYDRNVLRAGIDTLRGCPIKAMFAIDKGQAEELEYIGEEP